MNLRGEMLLLAQQAVLGTESHGQENGWAPFLDSGNKSAQQTCGRPRVPDHEETESTKNPSVFSETENSKGLNFLQPAFL